jgi:hypothetical protein
MTGTTFGAGLAWNPSVPFQTGTQPTLRQGRFWSLGVFYAGIVLVYLPGTMSGSMLGKGLIALGLVLALLLAPVEYALGAVAFAFLAAASINIQEQFLLWRWFFLAGGVVILSLRFFFRRRKSRRHGLNRFEYLLGLFLALAACSVAGSVSATLSSLKLAALAMVFLLSSLGSVHLVEIYGPAAPRRLACGLLAYCGGIVAWSLISYLFSLASPLRAGWFGGFVGHPNGWAVLVMTALPWIGCSLLRHRIWTGKLLALAGAVLVLSYSLFISGSRAGMLGAALAVSIAGLVHGSRRVASIILLLSVGFAVRALAQPDYLSQFARQYVWKHGSAATNLTSFRRQALQSRERPWMAVRQQFERNPWLGQGFGVSLASQADWVLDAETGASIQETGSSLWAALSQVGILGSTAVWLALLGLLWQGFRFTWRVHDPWFTAVYASVAALTVNAMFEGWMLAPGNFASTYFWVQCFFLNAMMCRFRPLAAAAAPPSFLQSEPELCRTR